MDILVLLGRILFVGIFAVSGIGHLTQTSAMTGYAASKHVPSARLAVLASGVLLVVGALMVALGAWADLGSLLLVAFLLPTALAMHGFWREKDAMDRQMEQVQFLKDLSLAGAALLAFALFAYVGSDLGLTLTGPLFALR